MVPLLYLYNNILQKFSIKQDKKTSIGDVSVFLSNAKINVNFILRKTCPENLSDAVSLAGIASFRFPRSILLIRNLTTMSKGGFLKEKDLINSLQDFP